MHHFNTPLYGDGEGFVVPLPTRHIFSVSPLAAQQLCSISDLYYAYGPQEMPFGTSNLDQAARFFEVDLSAYAHLGAYRYPFALESAILRKAAVGEVHTLYVLQKQGGFESGWMCLIPNARASGLNRILQQHRLIVEE
ncbi:hypothetical protein [Deinococcus roseus]|uniref:Uncharacterized protein n=1 Tax=Deinococcus roseus TaxID=392414 RepID=A0ABQ2CXU2_9DEIO|nr:hypothetical protein [Deinococcus roseus]GGJ27820.1 hypothetical protein GCM10008938_12350 [Deinococcus roseus]